MSFHVEHIDTLIFRKVDLLNDYSAQLNTSLPKDIDTMIEHTDTMWRFYCNHYNPHFTAEMYKALTENLVWLRSANDNDVAFTIYKLTYTIDEEQEGGKHARKSLEALCFFDRDDRLIGIYNDGKIPIKKPSNSPFPLTGYEREYISMKTDF